MEAGSWRLEDTVSLIISVVPANSMKFFTKKMIDF